MDRMDLPSGAMSYDELLDAARKVGLWDFEAVEAILIDTARLGVLRREMILMALRNSTGFSMGALREELQKSIIKDA